ncbi:response regulator [Bacillus salitolerans]|uniref:Response regulator n=1 Tax=Bacillus salitolerans TaxID=1437434 RepID=A0ABW4LWB3_9BACI
MNILLVDDEYLELEQLQYLIKTKFPMWNIYVAEDGSKALSIARAVTFPLALIDIQLPGDSGLTLIKKLRNIQPSISTIIISAHQEFQYAQEAIMLNVTGYVVKPVIENELFEVIHKFLHASNQVYGKSKVVQQMLDRIHEDYQEKLSLTTIAHQLHMNAPHLSKKFAEEVGMNFKDYLIKYRIEQAKVQMKRDPHASINDISDAVGFTSQHHFSNSFKKHEKTTPTKYKERFV